MDFFGTIAPVYDRLRRGHRRSFETLLRAVPFRVTDEVLDVGGGTGAVAQHFADLVASITVIEPSPGMLAECRLRKDVAALQGTAEKLPVPDGAVDKVIMVDAFHHVVAQDAAAAEIARVLRPGGVAVLLEFDPRRVVGRFVRLFERVMRMGSTFHAPEELAELFMRHGFDVHYVQQDGSEYVLVATKRPPAPNVVS